jgi:hypothetical protein
VSRYDRREPAGSRQPFAASPTESTMAADVLVVIHATFVLFVVTGGVLVWRWPRVAWLHVPAAIWGAAVELFGWICPLTPLENELRARAGAQGYTGGFVEHYLMPVLYPEGLTRNAQVMMGAFVVVLNVGVYAALVVRHRRLGRRASQ